ncbi:Phosphoacetylglucosamine Mutase [Rhizophlyctis rosea]|nr:Phosphoacetylglucosamine Mutase [Rhizophlyctis rosea]
MTIDTAKVKQLSAKHPKAPVSYTYGTAGFRTKADVLDSVLFRVGLLAVLRSQYHGGRTIGVMVTASHNAAEDNGVKLVEPLGEMLAQSWEVYATNLANAESDDALIAALESVIQKEGINTTVPANVVVGRDTRPSGEALVAAVKDGVAALGGKLTDFGIQTTPQLHYVTRCINTENTPEAYGVPTNDGYYAKLAAAFKRIVSGKPRLPMLHVDAANGVGAVALRGLAMAIGTEYLAVNIHNDDVQNAAKLNYDAGADFVKVKQREPVGLKLVAGENYASLDGDADRIVFYYADQAGHFKLLDGDKIATLAAGFIMDQVKAANVTIDGAPIKVGLVQTAYANGSSTAYVKEVLQVPVVFTPTGVKHLHHAAEEFDVGVYFEANGHGTVLFSKAAIEAFHKANGTTDAERKALDILRGLTDVINQAVGDALSDLLLVVAILVNQQRTFADWDSAYTDLPSRQEKVKVARRADFVPIKADTELAKPDGLQAKINAEVAKFPKGRAFVRPSGTEDVVRVYAEADTRDHADHLAKNLCDIVARDYVHTRWNLPIVEALLEGARSTLHDLNVKDITIQSVPGSYELPFAAQSLIRQSRPKYDAVICIGVLIKGSTMHFEYIADATSQGIMRVGLDEHVPVIFGVLTCLTEDQALERAALGKGANKGHNHGTDWGQAAVEMALLNKGK